MKVETWEAVIINKNPKVKDILIQVSSISKEDASALVRKFLTPNQILKELRAPRPNRTGASALRKRRSTTKPERRR